MKLRQRNILLFFIIVSVLVSVASSCSTQKNTGASRWWHSFNARYNTYYNGAQAYIEGSLAKEQGNKDNYTEIIPLYTVGNKTSRELGKGNYETAITKAQKAIQQHSIKKRPEWKKNRRKTERDIEWLNRREYNPFIWKAWMLMGRSQFYKGAFDEAAATFSYMSRLYRTQPAIYGKARAWLAKCYVEQDWLYDAEDVIRNMQRDSIDWRAQKEWDYTFADYYLRSNDYENAIIYLKKVIKHEQRAKQKAREWFLLGQIYAAQKQNIEAYDAFKHVIRQNPPYELEFNARIAMTEVMPSGASKSKISRLKRMARSDKNKEYLDQVYYAMGNVYLAEKDTMHAIGAYEQGNKKATRSGIEKGVLLLHLGDLYWAVEKFGDAQRCYGEAIGLLDKDRPDYPLLSERSKILDELAPHTENVHLQDSLQALAKMSEKDRNAAIDRVIEALKKKEKEERKAELEKQAQQNAAQGNTAGNNTARQNTPQQNIGNRNNPTWYFYNPTAVSQGKQTFAQQWGKRENADNWQRINKTVVSSGISEDGAEGEETSGEFAEGEKQDGALGEANDTVPKDSAALDPHKREYYLAQIPFTEEQLAASNEILADALFNSGIIFKDKLDNLQLSERNLTRLISTFPDFQKSDDIYYHLFLLHSRKGEKKKAKDCKEILAEKYPDSQWTKIVNDPYFEENARYGVHLEDSLYANTYEAFSNDQHSTISRNVHISEQRYPLGAHRDKFLFIGGLSRLNQNDPDSCVRSMERVVNEFPQSEVAGIAGMIINGVKAGKKLRGAKFDIADIWNYRTETLDERNDTTNFKFSDNPHENFVFLMTYNPDSLAFRNDSVMLVGSAVENQLLYDIARYNFTSYLVRNFDIGIEDFQGMHRLSVSGFQSYDEALVYARQLYQNTQIMEKARGSRNIIISETNLPLLGAQYSYNEYDEFYSEHFAPLPQPDFSILNDQIVSPELYDPESQPTTSEEQDDNEDEQSGNKEDNNIQDEFTIPEEQPAKVDTPIEDEIIIPEEKPAKVDTPFEDEIIIPEEKPAKADNPIEDNIIMPEEQPAKVDTPFEDEIIIPEEKPAKVDNPIEDNIIIEDIQPVKKVEPKKENPKQNVPVKQTEKKNSTSTVRQDINSDILEIIDEDAPQSISSPETKDNNNQNQQEDDDEYFDLDGF